MQVPQRRAQLLQKRDDSEQTVYLTASTIERMKRDLEDLEKVQMRPARDEVARTVAMGDLSENADYHEAKKRLGSINGKIFSIKDRLKRAVIIDTNRPSDGRVHLGSTVVVEGNNLQKTYQLVGPQESNPTRGRISHLSPLGSALLNREIGETVTIQTPGGEMMWRIVEIR